jgi:hypothetical protein
MINILEAITIWIVAVVLRFPLILLGLPLTALGLLMPVKTLPAIKFTRHNINREWYHVGLPRWLWIFSNDRDGAKGDKRGWWDMNCPTGNSDDFFSRWVWMAVRNPVNNMRFTPIFSVNMFETEVELLAGQYNVDDDDDGSALGWQFVMARGSVFKYYCFKWLSQPMPAWFVKIFPSQKDHVFRIWIGHKLAPRYNDDFPKGQASFHPEDRVHKAWKGFTFRVGFLDYKN